MMVRPALIAALAGAASAGTLIPAAAAGQQAPPALNFDKPCYSEGETIHYTGNGFTPSGPVDLLFSFPSGASGGFAAVADGTGAVDGTMPAPQGADGFLDENAIAEDVSVTATDRTRTQSQPPADPALQAASATMRFSRFGVLSNRRRIVPSKSIRFLAVGFTGAVGQPLYMHYVKGGRSVHRVSAGPLTGPCGDRAKSLGRAFPKSLPAGRYRIYWTTGRIDPQDGIWIRSELIRVGR